MPSRGVPLDRISTLGHPYGGRRSDEENRASTPLELFYDLVIVVAVAVAASELHHNIADGELAIFDSILGFALAFFAIWWAWMGFTWFATAYDTDDVPYRIAASSR
jgi:low temperature requirement protein LtrA